MRYMDRKQIQNTLLLVFTAMIWGCSFVAQTVGAEHVGTFTFLASRSWLGGIVLLPVIAFSDYREKRSGTYQTQSKNTLRTLIWGGIACGVCLFFAAATQQMGVAQTTTAKAGFITTLYVLMVPILTLFMGRKIGKKIWLCVMMGVIGLYFLCMADSISLNKGDALVLLCAFLFSLHILVIDHFSPKVNSIKLSCIQFFTTAVIATVFTFLFEHPTAQTLLAAALPIMYAGILSSGVGFTLQVVAQKDLNPTIASLAMSLESVFSALAGWILLGQSLSVRELFGCALMFTAIVIAQLPDRKTASAQP